MPYFPSYQRKELEELVVGMAPAVRTASAYCEFQMACLWNRSGRRSEKMKKMK
jgi:hypothetical protein